MTLCRDCFFTTNSVHKKSDFIDQLNRSGGGGLTLSLRDSELTDFYHYLCKAFNFEDESNRKFGASFIGLQQDDTWILSPGMQIDADGKLIKNPYESKYVWLPHIAAQYAGGSDVNFGSLSPDVHLPLTTDPLKPMLECMQLCFKHNFISSLLACSSILMGLHYDKVRAHYEGCPIPFFYGESQTGKTGTAKIASSIVGMHKRGFYKKNTSQKWFQDRCSMSSMPFTIDDPRERDRSGKTTVSSALMDYVNDIYDGGVVANFRTGPLVPRSVCVITSNAIPSADK